MKQQNSNNQSKKKRTSTAKFKGKVIPLKSAENKAQPDEHGKISIAQCRDILWREGAEYTDEEVALLRKVLYALAEVDYAYHCKQSSRQLTTHTIPLNTISQKVNEQQEGNYLHPGIYRRTG